MQFGELPEELFGRVGEIWSLAFEYQAQSFWHEWVKRSDVLPQYGVRDLYGIAGGASVFTGERF